MLHSFLAQIKDHPRGQGKRYKQEHIQLSTILAILSQATSYRKVSQFIANHYSRLDEIFGLNWKRKPAYTTIREIIHKTSKEELEQSFRQYSLSLVELGGAVTFIRCGGFLLYFNNCFKCPAILSGYS